MESNVAQAFLTYFLTLMTVCNANGNANSNEPALSSFEWNHLTRVTLTSRGDPLAIDTPGGVPSDTAFLMLQGHTLPPETTIELSTRPKFDDPTRVATGSHVGLVSMATDQRHWYAKWRPDNGSGTNDTRRDAWLLFAAKAWDEPLPGGCCRAARRGGDDCATAAGVRVSRRASGAIISLEFEPAAALTSPPAVPPAQRASPNCSAASQSERLHYRLYVMQASCAAASSSASPLNSSWLATLRFMSTAQDAVAYGRLIGAFGGGTCGGDGYSSGCRFLIAARDNLPLVATVVAERRDSSQFSAYAPVLLSPLADACNACLDIECRLLSILATIVGLFLCTVGFRFFSTSVFLSGFACGSLLLLPILLRNTGAPLWLASLIAVAGGGSAVGAAALALWLRLGSNPQAYLTVHLPCCYALACLLFATPFGRLWWLAGHESVFLATLALTLVLCLMLLLLFAGLGAIFSLSLVGTFAVAVSLSLNLPHLAATFPYTFLDLARRTAYGDYNGAHLVYNFDSAVDLILAAAWLTVAAACCLLQYFSNRRHGFDPSLLLRLRRMQPPPPPLQQHQQRRQRPLNVSFGGGGVLAGDECPDVPPAPRSRVPAGVAGVNERTPLLLPPPG